MSNDDTLDVDGNGPIPKKRRTQENNNNSISSSSEEDSNLIVPRRILQDDALKKCGILEWVTVKNFMCHDHLSFEFSPYINFVQGRNGSGKSAILTAVVVGLGGGARFTNRGHSMKELVKHGKQIAVVEISIRNYGSYPFKPEVYGKSIVVERKIFAAGGGGYKIKTDTGMVVSTKKEDLARILEHFNLQVDNPVTILNQDMSRSFLHTMDPKALFKFFLKATQLQQMKENYNNLQNNIQSSLRLIDNRKKVIPELEKEVEEQRSRYEFSVSLREKKKKLQDLRHELAWANIIHKEKEKEKSEQVLENLRKDRGQLKEKIASMKSIMDQEKELTLKATEDFNEATYHLEAAQKEVKGFESKIRMVKETYRNKQSQVHVAEKRVRTINSELATLRAAIEKNDNSHQKKWLEERAEWQRKIGENEVQIKETAENIKTEMNHCQNLQNTLEVKRSDEKQQLTEEKAAQRQLNDLVKELNGLQSQQGSQLTVYGQWVPQLLKKIDVAHSRNKFVKKPVGPLGAFIEVRDKKWGHVAETVLGGRMTSFCVDNRSDEKVLSELMEEVTFNQQGKPIVTVAKFRDKVHDVSRFETSSPHYSSLWSMLSVSNSVVANTIIDQLQVESILLIPTAQEAGKLLKDRATVPKNCKCAYTLNLDLYYPDPNYRLYSGKGSRKAKFLQVSVEDRIRDIMANKEECEKQIASLLVQTKQVKMEVKQLEGEIATSYSKTRQFKKQLDTLRSKATELKNQELQPPPDISQLEDDVKQQTEVLNKAVSEVEDLRNSMAAIKTKYNDMNKEVQELRQAENLAYEKANKCKKELDKYKANTALSSIGVYNKKDHELQKKEKILLDDVNSKTQSLNASLKSIEGVDIGPRIETRRTVQELERQYNSLQARLNKETADSGDPIVIAERYKTTKMRYKQISKDMEKQECLLKKLRESLNNREEKCERFNKWLAIIVKYFFKEHLSVRKLNGSLDINFNQKRLTIQVEKPEINNSQDNRKAKTKAEALKQLAMMSGGERSFSTVSFIIALWHAIDSPVRILDEFDVFMDVIARNRAMRMMISAAKPVNQYIFLTPLNLDISRLNNCAIFRMPDPESQEEEDAATSET